MESALFFSCSLLLGTTLGQNNGNVRLMNRVFESISDVVNMPVDVAHEKVKLTTQLAHSGVEHGANIGKMGVTAGAALTSQGLGGGTNVAKQAVDVLGTVSEIVPGSEILPVRHVTEGGKMVLDITNNIGQQGIKGTSYLGTEVLDKTKTVSNITAGTLENLSSAGAGFTKGTVSTTLNAVANVLNMGTDAVMALVPAIQAVPNGIISSIQTLWSYFISLFGY